MKPTIILITLFFASKLFAQTDTIFVKGNNQIICTNIKEDADLYKFTFLNTAGQKTKSSILKYLVDSIKYFVPIANDTNNIEKLSNKALRKKRKKEIADSLAKVNAQQPTVEKAWKKTIAVGLNFGGVLEENNPSGTDIKNVSANISLDLGLNYNKPEKRFAITNELHYLFGVQKTGLTAGSKLQRIQDDLSTLHDASLRIGKKSKWNFNAIIRTATSIFTVFNGDYFKDFTTLGKEKAFASPYDVTVSPGFKYQPNQNFRVSISPYSFNLYGVKNNQISTKGIYITDTLASGAYKTFLYKRLGAEINFWYDKQIKQWLTMQYRLSFSSDYFEKFGKNGKMDGLFITRIKIWKDVYFTHRMSLKNDLTGNLLKPYFNQNLLLSYSKSF